MHGMLWNVLGHDDSAGMEGYRMFYDILSGSVRFCLILYVV